MFVAYVQLFIVQLFEVSNQIDVSIVDCISVFSRGRETSSQAHSVQCKSIFDVCNECDCIFEISFGMLQAHRNRSGS